ncbi:MAG: hypothetical protein SOV43_01460 [Selenomonadaceae bacterium]|nr:hypothetical protein [Selenomonadaceae bacterium]MDY2684823.1 hypothetical protein [Selenomonadaceae bacterium]
MSKSAAFIHHQKFLQWKQIIADRQASGLAIVEYTRLHHISRQRYYYWLRCIREEMLEKYADAVQQAVESVTRGRLQKMFVWIYGSWLSFQDFKHFRFLPQ